MFANVDTLMEGSMSNYLDQPIKFISCGCCRIASLCSCCYILLFNPIHCVQLPLKRLCILCTHLPGVCLCEEQGFNLAFLVHPNAPSIAQKCGFIDWISMQGCHLARYYCTRITGD